MIESGYVGNEKSYRVFISSSYIFGFALHVLCFPVRPFSILSRSGGTCNFHNKGADDNGMDDLPHRRVDYLIEYTLLALLPCPCSCSCVEDDCQIFRLLCNIDGTRYAQ